MASKKRITLTLSNANAADLEIVSAVLKKPINEIISSCLRGSTNPNRKK